MRTVECTQSAIKIMAERARNHKVFGEHNHDPIMWVSILMEQVGKMSKAALKARFGNPEDQNQLIESLQIDVIKVAAISMEIVECMDRGEWIWLDSRSTE